MINLNPVFVSLAVLVGTVIMAVAVPLVKRKKTEDQWEMIVNYALALVQSAELIWGAGKGEKKLRYAIDRLEKYCHEKGIQLDVVKIKHAVEDAWKKMGLDVYHPKSQK